MLIAVAKEGEMVCEHFGHCEAFALYNTDNGQNGVLANPGHQPGFLPGFLKQHGVQAVISGGMGQKAQELFSMQGIQVFVGAKGKITEVIESYLAGQLASSGEVCSRHEHAGDCHHE